MEQDLSKIGFYTLSDFRCKNASVSSDLQRCELLLSANCNFKCRYCRQVGGPDLPQKDAENIVRLWCSQNLKNIRFSGGEPTLYPGIVKLVRLAKELGVERIALSTNGSASKTLYDDLLEAGVSDFSVSLDACCASKGDMLSGMEGMWETVVDNIQYLSAKTYVTIGCVLTEENADDINDIIVFADSLGVSDIRIIPAAQDGDRLKNVYVDPLMLEKYPILKYRIKNLQEGKPVRGLSENDSNRCGLILDDMAVMGNKHYPCIIYLREGGEAIGEVGSNMRKEREQWYLSHNVKKDRICSKNCLDVCSNYNFKFEEFHKIKEK